MLSGITAVDLELEIYSKSPGHREMMTRISCFLSFYNSFRVEHIRIYFRSWRSCTSKLVEDSLWWQVLVQDPAFYPTMNLSSRRKRGRMCLDFNVYELLVQKGNILWYWTLILVKFNLLILDINFRGFYRLLFPWEFANRRLFTFLLGASLHLHLRVFSWILWFYRGASVRVCWTTCLDIIWDGKENRVVFQVWGWTLIHSGNF